MKGIEGGFIDFKSDGCDIRIENSVELSVSLETIHFTDQSKYILSNNIFRNINLRCYGVRFVFQGNYLRGEPNSISLHSLSDITIEGNIFGEDEETALILSLSTSFGSVNIVNNVFMCPTSMKLATFRDVILNNCSFEAGLDWIQDGAVPSFPIQNSLVDCIRDGGGVVQILNSSFSGNGEWQFKPLFQVGQISQPHEGAILIRNSSFLNHCLDGIGAWASIHSFSAEIDNCTFQNLHSTSKGGAISTTSVVVSIYNSIFQNNTSQFHGDNHESSLHRSS